MINALDYLTMVWKGVHQFKYSKIDKDELYEIGLDNLFLAIKNYNKTKGNFAPYAYTYIILGIKDYIRKENRRRVMGKSNSSSDELLDINLTEFKSLTMPEELNTEDFIINKKNIEKLLMYFIKLPEIEQKILEYRYYKEKPLPYYEIEKLMSIERRTVKQIENRALEKLRQSLCA